MTSKKPATGKSRSTSTARPAASAPKPGAKKDSGRVATSAKTSPKRVAGRERSSASHAPDPATTSPHRSTAPAPKQRTAPAKERPPAGKSKGTAPAVKDRGGAGAKGRIAPPMAKERAAAPTAKERAAAAAAARTKPAATVAKKVPASTAAGTKRRTAKELLASETPDAVAAAVSKLAPDSNGYVVVNGRRLRIMSQSTKPLAVVRRIKGRATAAAAAEPELDPDKPVRTKLNKRELDRYRTMLLAERGQLVGDLAAMEDQALRSSGGNLSHMPIHMADLGTDTFDQDFMLGMAENERRRLREIDEALMRIMNGTYGVCMSTGKPIPKARLEAKPWAKNTIEAAREIERGLTE